jgi:hypothetical protein
MAGSCVGKCQFFTKARTGGFSFKDGKFVKCRTCAMAFHYEGLWCPCCGKKVSRRSKKNPAIPSGRI